MCASIARNFFKASFLVSVAFIEKLFKLRRFFFEDLGDVILDAVVSEIFAYVHCTHGNLLPNHQGSTILEGFEKLITFSLDMKSSAEIYFHILVLLHWIIFGPIEDEDSLKALD